MIAPGVIIPFVGQHSQIPDGFVRDTRFDGMIPKGATTNLGTVGGSLNHQHSAPHAHPIAPHTHPVSTGGRIDGSTFGMGTSGNRSDQNHSHNGNTGSAGSEQSESTNLVVDSVNNTPPFFEVIFIRALKYSLIPENGMVLREEARDELTYHAASENRFLKGAGANQDAGATGGSATHQHTQSHTHVPKAHSHSTGRVSNTPGSGEDGMSSPAMSNNDHSHQFTVKTAIQNMNANTDPTSSANLEPLHKTLLHYLAEANALPKIGDIAMLIDDEIPIGWVECNGENDTPNLVGFYIKNTDTPLQEGGANSHTHTLNHGHTGNGTHTHTPNNPTAFNSVIGGRHGSGKTGVAAHRHNVTSVSAVTANYSSVNVTTSEESNEPPFIRVRFIQMVLPTAAGGGVVPRFL